MQLQATAGLGGHLVVGEWAPVSVIVENSGKETRGDLVIPPQMATDDQHEYRVAIDVPPSSRRAFTLYLRYLIDASEVIVEFQPDRGRKKVRTKATCSAHDAGSRLVYVISRAAGGLSYLGAVPMPTVTDEYGTHGSRDSVVAYATPDRATGAMDLPDHAVGYAAASAVVLRDISPSSFEASEQEALRQWVLGGGLLVIMAGPNSAEYKDSFIAELCPGELQGQRTIAHLGAFPAYYGGVIEFQRALVMECEPKEGAEVVVEQSGVPLLVKGRQQSGTVYFCAADCAAAPMKSQDHLLKEMWLDILSNQALSGRWAPLQRLAAQSLGEIGGLSEAVVRLPVVEWDAFVWVGGILLAYVVLLVGTGLLLKKLDRREWMGVGILVLIAVFSLTILLLGRSTSVASFRSYEAGVALAQSGSTTAWLDGVSAIRSPAAKRFTLTSSGASRTVEFLAGSHKARQWPVYQGQSFSIRNVPVDMGGFGAFRIQGPWDLGGPISAQIVRDGEKVAVLVNNGTPYELKYPFILSGDAMHPLDSAIGPGESKPSGPMSLPQLRSPSQDRGVAAFQALRGHCNATDDKLAPPDQRIRSRVLQQLSSDTDPYSHGGYSSGYGGPPGMMSGPQPMPMNVNLTEYPPMFGAWIEPSTPIADVGAAKQQRVSQVLVLVEIPLNVLPASLIPATFEEVYPNVDTRTGQVYVTNKNQVVFSSGTHEMDFMVPNYNARRGVRRLALNLGTNVEGVKAEILNLRTSGWEQLRVGVERRIENRLRPPGDYVRANGRVSLRLSRTQRAETIVGCELTGTHGQAQ